MRTPDDYHKLIAETVIKRADELSRFIDYIEVGVLTGNSAEAVLSTCKVRNATLIDNFSNSYCGEWKSSKAQVEERLSPFYGIFEILEGDSRRVLPLIIDDFDIGFVDGDHSEAVCLEDMQNMLPLLRQDGIMFVDDLGPNGCSLLPIVERFAKENDLNLALHNVHNILGQLWRG